MGVLPTLSMSPVLMHFWHVVALFTSSFPFPKNMSLNWFIPAPVNKRVGSSSGTSESLGNIECPFFSKKLKYFLLITLVSIILGDILHAPIAKSRQILRQNIHRTNTSGCF